MNDRTNDYLMFLRRSDKMTQYEGGRKWAYISMDTGLLAQWLRVDVQVFIAQTNVPADLRVVGIEQTIEMLSQGIFRIYVESDGFAALAPGAICPAFDVEYSTAVYRSDGKGKL